MRIKGYENYEVRPNGEVINTKTGRVLKHCKDSNGYLCVNLSENGKKKKFLIHRLVAEAFIPNPDNLPEVNHKDEDKTNNFVFLNEDGSVDEEKSNLEWCTHEYNINYGTRNKRVAKTVLQLRKDGSLVRIWPSTIEIQRKNKFNNAHISACCRGERHSAYGYKWSYTD